MTVQSSATEATSIAERYARRKDDGRYSLLDPAALLIAQERQRAMTKLFRYLGWANLSQMSLLEVGCGYGDNLLEFLRLGFRPEHLCGIEVQPDRVALALHRLPGSLQVHYQDAATGPDQVPLESQDIVYQSVVFSSVLDDAYQIRLAARMWQWVKPGGGILWYDFAVNNPRNPDVRGVSVKRIRQLFPGGRLLVIKKVTLAPPLARAFPSLYGLFNLCPWLRTHRLVWIGKPVD